MNLIVPLLPTAHQLLWLAFRIFKLFGFIPFPFDCCQFKLKSCSRSKSLLHLPVLQFLFYFAIIGIAMKYRVNNLHTNLKVLSMNDLLKYSSQIMAILVILVNTVLQRDIHRSVWEKLDRIRYVARKVFLRRFIRLYLCKFYGYLALSAIIATQMIYVVKESPFELAFCALVLVLHAFLRLRHLFHMLFIDVLKIQLQQLHYHLTELGEYMRELNSHPPDSPTHRNVYERSVKRLLELKDTYGQLWEISDCINRTFGWSQICNFTGNFVQLSCDLYWCYLYVQGVTVGAYQTVFVMLLPTALILGLLLSSAESCLRMAARLPQALLEVPVGHDCKLRRIIYRFGLQIAQQRIRLTAHGLFEINYSLLKMFGTGITTYMIIFISFSRESPLMELQEGLLINISDD
uniref:Gustatory receptor n=1 Tax=Anopheles farauti TaxID=69004 RepID=A0A182QH11_9DIPT